MQANLVNLNPNAKPPVKLLNGNPIKIIKKKAMSPENQVSGEGKIPNFKLGNNKVLKLRKSPSPPNIKSGAPILVVPKQSIKEAGTARPELASDFIK